MSNFELKNWFEIHVCLFQKAICNVKENVEEIGYTATYDEILGRYESQLTLSNESQILRVGKLARNLFPNDLAS